MTDGRPDGRTEGQAVGDTESTRPPVRLSARPAYRPPLLKEQPVGDPAVPRLELREWAEPQLTPMLWKAVEETLPTDARDLGDLPTVFVHCARGKFFDDSAVELRSQGIPVMTLDEGHMPHLTSPRRLAAMLIRAEHELGRRTVSHDASS